MTYSDFKQHIVSHFREKLGSHAKISILPVTKNNHVQLDGLVILENESNVSPTIYLNYYYEQYTSGTPLDKILSVLFQTYLSNRSETSIDTSFFTDYTNMASHVAYKLIHASSNEALLSDVPHKRFLDLAIVCYCLISASPSQNATILIRNQHLSLWNLHPDTLFEQAVSNTPSLLPYTFLDMNAMLKNLTSHDAPELSPAADPMFILGNTKKLYGASSLLYPGVLKEISASVNDSFYILPSSIHEVLLLPASTNPNLSELNKMVRDVNHTQVSPEEVLSDHVYYYSITENTIKIPS